MTGSYLVHSASEDGFWSNADGWVGDPKDATLFSAHERLAVSLPASNGRDATWHPSTDFLA